MSQKYPMTKEGLEAFVRDAEAHGPMRQFLPATFPLDEMWEGKPIATIRGTGCIYRVYGLVDGKVISTYQGDGPWPYASVEWVADTEPHEYENALMLIAAAAARDGGTDPLVVMDEVRALWEMRYKRPES